MFWLKLYDAVKILMLWLLFASAEVSKSIPSEDQIKQLLALRADPYASRCGSWQKEYTSFHSTSLLAGRPRLLVAIPNLSGLADRIIGFSTVFMIAYLTNRTFQIGDRSPLPRIEDVFISPHINWSRPSEPEWIIEPLKFRANPRNYNSSVLDSHEYYAVNTIEDYKLLDRLLRFDLNEIMNKEAWTTLISINRGKTIRMFENQKHITRLNATGLTPSTAFGCIVNYLIKPKPEVFLPVLDQLHTMATLTPDTLKIGIQIRTGDRTMGNSHHAPVDDYAGFFNCAKEIEHFALTANPQYKKAIWYLITDLKSVREDAVAKFGDKILTSVNVHIEHSSKEESVCKNGNCGNVTLYGFSTAAAEWWMFSMADYFVISEYSGFGRSAAMHSLKTSSIYTIPWKRMKAGVSCSNESYTQLENLSYEWSGI